MTKEQAKNLFGKRYSDMAKALKKARSTICEWPDELNNDQTNMVIGAAMRNGIKVPSHMLK